jgi:uncharacterized lipoprotein YmbA
MPTLPHPTLRRRTLAAWLLSSPWLTACVTPLPATTWLRLPLLAPDDLATTNAAPQSHRPVLLLLPLQLAGHLDREALVSASGPGTLRASTQARWAEPLREAMARALHHDLERQLGAGRVWRAPVPDGMAIGARLRLDILAFEQDAQRQGVHLQARWQISGAASGGAAPVSATADLSVPLASPQLDDVVLAHRRALHQLAVRIAASVPVTGG